MGATELIKCLIEWHYDGQPNPFHKRKSLVINKRTLKDYLFWNSLPMDDARTENTNFWTFDSVIFLF